MRHAKTHPSLHCSLRLKSKIGCQKEITEETQCIPYRIGDIHINPMQQHPIDSIVNRKSYHTDYPETNSLSYYRPIKFQSLNSKL